MNRFDHAFFAHLTTVLEPNLLKVTIRRWKTSGECKVDAKVDVEVKEDGRHQLVLKSDGDGDAEEHAK